MTRPPRAASSTYVLMVFLLTGQRYRSLTAYWRSPPSSRALVPEEDHPVAERSRLDQPDGHVGPASGVVAGVDVDAGHALGLEHLVGAAVVLERQLQVEPDPAQ